MPVGIRVTTLFLRVMVVALIFPLVAIVPSCLFSLGMVFVAAGVVNPVLFAALNLGFFLILLATAIGGEWMIQFLRARHSPPNSILRHVMPPHPALKIGMPLITLLNVYAIMAIISWLVAVIGNLAPTNWVWLVFWLVTAVASYLSIQRLKAWSSKRASAPEGS
jgi:hypothetical protein